MRLIKNSFIAAVTVAFAAGAVAQTTAPASDTSPPATAPGQTGTTPGQMQTTPGAASDTTPASTGQTPSGETTGQATTTQMVPATASDVKKGVSVYDQNGAMVGKIDSVTADGAVLKMGSTRAQMPLSSFAKSDKGLVIGMTKEDLEAAAKKSTPSSK